MSIEKFNILILVLLGGIYIGIIYFLKRHKFPSFQENKFFKELTQERILFFDFVKGVAILAVIVIHIVFFLKAFEDKFSLSFLKWLEHINRLARFAIPVFFISSGALLTLKDLKINTLKKFYLAKFQRIVIPYIFFSSFATCLYSPGGNYFLKAIRDIFTGGALVTFWFMPVLFQLYFSFPVFWYLFVVKRVKPHIILLFSFLSSLGFYFLSTEFTEFELLFRTFSLYFGHFLFFFVLGMVLKPLLFLENREWLKKIYLPLWSVFVIALYLGISAVNPLETYYNYRYIYGPTIFLALFYFYPFLSRFKISKFIEKIGRHSLYLYLIHFFVLSFLIRLILFLNLFYINPFLLFLGLFFFGFLISYFLGLLTLRFYNFLYNLLLFQKAEFYNKN